jgi:hypothetical protein
MENRHEDTGRTNLLFKNGFYAYFTEDSGSTQNDISKRNEYWKPFAWFLE